MVVDAGVRYTVTRRGAPSLLVAGYEFVARKRRGARVYWSCRERRRCGCAARALTCAGRLVVAPAAAALTPAHCHAPDANHTLIESYIETFAYPS